MSVDKLGDSTKSSLCSGLENRMLDNIGDCLQWRLSDKLWPYLRGHLWSCLERGLENCLKGVLDERR